MKRFLGVQGAIFQKSPLPAGGKEIAMKRENKLSKSFVIAIFLFAFAVVSIGRDNGNHANVVKIIKPISGWSGDRVIELEAEIQDPAIGFAYLVENGNERMVRVRNQRVAEKLVLSPGSNQIVVQVKKDGVLHSDHVVLYSSVPKKDIKIILTWDTDGTDVDLHVVNPAGVDCYYGNKETEEGGQLDIDITDGYGPEVFTQSNAGVGEYLVKVHYFGSHGHPQSIAKVQVILFEGTDFEKKYRFEKVLVKTDDTFQVGSFNVDRLGREKERP